MGRSTCPQLAFSESDTDSTRVGLWGTQWGHTPALVPRSFSTQPCTGAGVGDWGCEGEQMGARCYGEVAHCPQRGCPL